MGAGTQTCTAFANWYRKDASLAENVYFAWAQGFMSALNIARLNNGTESKNLIAMSIDQEMRYLRTYCNDHPWLNISRASGYCLRSYRRILRQRHKAEQ
jgi:hypothetical protein